MIDEYYGRASNISHENRRTKLAGHRMTSEIFRDMLSQQDSVGN